MNFIVSSLSLTHSLSIALLHTTSPFNLYTLDIIVFLDLVLRRRPTCLVWPIPIRLLPRRPDGPLPPNLAPIRIGFSAPSTAYVLGIMIAGP